jgi:hypothetical protein
MAKRLTRHARDRMAQRGITEEDIDSALRRTSRSEPGAPGTIWVYGYTTTGRELKVCVDVHDRDRVVTVAWPDP